MDCCRVIDDDGFSVVFYKGKRKKRLKKVRSGCVRSLVTKEIIPSDSLPENFAEVMKNVQDELKCSDFITRFEEDLRTVLDEWDFGYVANSQDSGPTDIPNLSKSFQTVSKETSDIDIVCYGLGQFSSSYIAKYQLGFLLLLKRILHSVHVYIYDPKFSTEEINFLRELDLDVLSIDEEAKRTLSKKSVCFMPHCDLPLYNNLLWANWNAKRLSDLMIIGNSFQSYELNNGAKALPIAKYVFLANKFVTELKMANVFHFHDIFNDLSVHYFKSSSLSSVDSLVWTDSEEPEYSVQNDLIIKRKCEASEQ